MTGYGEVRQAIANVMASAHWFAAPSSPLEWEHLPSSTIPWEVSHGRLIPRRHCRATAVLETWSVYALAKGQRSGEPLVSLKLDAEAGVVHIVRGLLCWIWEGYDSGDNVFLSREVQGWVPELVGTFDVGTCSSGVLLREHLAMWIHLAVRGISRLPLTSLEAPLPGFSLGELAYFHYPRRPAGGHRGADRPMTCWGDLLAVYRPDLNPRTRISWLEFMLRCVPADELADAATELERLWQQNHHTAADFLTLLRAVFDGVSLSPYTDFADKTLALFRLLGEQGFLSAGEHVDALSWLLRRLARHLTAYDLVIFHHRGANYPDLLLLDAALKELLGLVEQHPALFMGDSRSARLGRRALRLAWLQRRRYEGHPVPDAPTSPGENARVLPPPHVRVPDEQILNPAKRTRRLFVDDPLPKHLGTHGLHVLKECGRDLASEAEVRELGMALFIERPLGGVKPPGEVDTSPLLAHEAFSRSLAERAMAQLAGDPALGLSAQLVSRYRSALAEPWPAGGIPASSLPREPPRIVSLADAAKSAGDFVILRTLPGGVEEFSRWGNIAEVLRHRGLQLDRVETWLIVANVAPSGKPGVVICRADGQPLVQLEVDPSQNVRDVTHELVAQDQRA